MNKKNAFTLVELIAVIAILAVILVMFVPNLLNGINSKKNDALNKVYDIIETATRNYVIDYNISTPTKIELEDLCKTTYIECPIINPNTEEELDGYIFVNNDYIYSEITETPLIVDLNGGETSQTFNDTYEPGTVIELTTPTKVETEFKGWKVVKGNSGIKDNKLVIGTTETILWAEWKGYPIIEFDLDGGTVLSNQSGKYMSGTVMELEIPTKEGYTFIGWRITSGNGNISGNIFTVGNSDTTVTANWKGNTYTVTFNPGDGTVSTTSKDVIYNSTYGELPTPTREGYIFAGWYTETAGGEEITENIVYSLMDNQTLYAHWEKSEFAYTGDYQTFEVPRDGYYKIELWGASGGSLLKNGNSLGDMTSHSDICEIEDLGKCYGGPGAKTSGYIYAKKGEVFYVYVGGKGETGKIDGTALGGYNGGGTGDNDHNDDEASGGGGGATDIRYFNSNVANDELVWNSEIGLNSRIMVASGGGGAADVYSGLIGGGLIGERKNVLGFENTVISVPTQTSGNAFGIGQNGIYETVNYPPSGAGGGYYGGYMSPNAEFSNLQSGGGSSFISGYAGVNAITSSTDRTHTNNTLHYSDKYFINGEMQAGVNAGNGKAEITYIGATYEKKNTKLNNVRYIKDCVTGNSANGLATWMEIQAIKSGINVAYQKNIIDPTEIENPNTLTYDVITDGQLSGRANAYSDQQGLLRCVTVDLENTYDLDEIAIWHYFDESFSYNNHSLYVSSDNTNWTTLIDNVSGVVETSNGIRVSAYD